jgi:hypothetical protein
VVPRREAEDVEGRKEQLNVALIGYIPGLEVRTERRLERH